MALLRRLFGGTKRDALDPREALDEARGDERRLRSIGTRHRGTFRHGGELHAAYRDAWHATHGSAPVTPPDDVHLARWEDLTEPSVRDIVDLCATTELPYLLVRADDPRAVSGAGGELEALAQLEREPDVALVLVGDVDILVRRAFLLDLLASDDLPDALEVVPELTDLANARGLRATFVPG